MRHKRVLVERYGGPDVITVIEEDIPVPKAREVRVKLLAAGVSLPDVLAREGVHPETPRVPYTPGWDLVGTVDQPGEGVTGFEPGQTVAAMPIHGCYAQYVCVSWRKLVPVPAGLDPTEAVAVVLNYITAYQMLQDRMTVQIRREVKTCAWMLRRPSEGPRQLRPFPRAAAAPQSFGTRRGRRRSSGIPQ
jgi:NADPH:quinone reductase-like Zn-dependent oxidoreductase